MITNDRFDTIAVKEIDGRWVVCDADGVALYEYTTERAAIHRAEQVRRWGRNESGGSATPSKRLGTEYREGFLETLHHESPVPCDRQNAPAGTPAAALPNSSRPMNDSSMRAEVHRAVAKRETQSGLGLGGEITRSHDERIELMNLLVQTYRHLTDNLESELEAAVGIPVVFFDVLLHVSEAPEGRLTMSRLSTQVALITGGITRLVDRMAVAGLVARQNSSSDRRRVQVALTEAGREVLERAAAAHVGSIDRLLVAPLSGDDRAALAVMLRKVLGEVRSKDDNRC
jgi:DNA-binding MarR family transcriptional regulator